MRTPGQDRAMRELERIQSASNGDVELDEAFLASSGSLFVPVTIRIGHVERASGGLQLRDREPFFISISKDFPFKKPSLAVLHERFAGFPHVIWKKCICLYQSDLEWNPSDGMYGFMLRVSQWLAQAAANQMDPIEGPLEPPHHVTNYSITPFMISADSPVAAGTAWIGFAELKHHTHQIEVIGWRNDVDEGPADVPLALTVILKDRLPMEFPENGRQFFNELEKQGLDRKLLLTLLRIAAKHGKENDRVHFVVGSPALRAADQSTRHHFAVWASQYRSALNALSPASGDSASLVEAKNAVALDLAEDLLDKNLSWCKVYENRREVNVRRDRGRPMSAMYGKRVLLLGCGALGSWAAEALARAGVTALDVVDNGAVKPGLLVRQNFTTADIGRNKAAAIADRIQLISSTIVRPYDRDAYDFMADPESHIENYDLVVDCTASHIFHMRLEHGWPRIRDNIPRFASLIIDASAECGIGIDLSRTCSHGPWVAYLLLKQRLCSRAATQALASRFYTDQPAKGLFQPEPGCSDPTFAGSSADAMSAVSAFLNAMAVGVGTADHGHGFVYWGAEPSADGHGSEEFALPVLKETLPGFTRVYIAPKALDRVRAFILKSSEIRSPRDETGGLLWGYWDDAANIVVVSDVSGPPSDSVHDHGHFTCGTRGTQADHRRRFEKSRGAEGFLGMWHTHPGMSPEQSMVDVAGMSTMVAGIGQNHRRALMLIFGSQHGGNELGVYVYESGAARAAVETVIVGADRIGLADPVFPPPPNRRRRR